MITHTALQFQAMKKLVAGPRPDIRLMRYHAIHQLAVKPHPLTAADVQMLEHYVHSNTHVLDNTVYWGNSTISPVTKNVTQHQIPRKPQEK